MTDKEKPGDSDVTAEAAPKDADKKDLNSVLASWDETDESSDTETPEATPSTTQSLGDMEYARDKAVTAIKGDLDVPDSFVLNYLVGLSTENEGFDTAFRERLMKPEKWEAALNKVAEDFHKTMKPEKPADTPKDDTGLAAAVHAARTTDAGGGGLDDIDYGSLSDTDFQLKKAEIFRLAERGELK